MCGCLVRVFILHWACCAGSIRCEGASVVMNRANVSRPNNLLHKLSVSLSNENKEHYNKISSLNYLLKILKNVSDFRTVAVLTGKWYFLSYRNKTHLYALFLLLMSEKKEKKNQKKNITVRIWVIFFCYFQTFDHVNNACWGKYLFIKRVNVRKRHF